MAGKKGALPRGGEKRRGQRRAGAKKKSLPLVPTLIIAAGLLGAGGLAALILWPRPVWYVDEALYNNWGRILRRGDAPFTRFEPLPPGGELPARRYGCIITTQPPPEESPEEGAGEAPVRVFRDLASTREYRDAQVLAVDPWMIFRKHQDEEPGAERIYRASGGPGLLVLPGAAEDAVTAWLAQLLQEQPQVFPEERALWEEARGDLFRGRRFQQGALTYNWQEAWSLVWGEETAWIYAPLSQVRGFNNYRQGLLDATLFPVRSGWNTYGVQGEVLWAIPFGKPEHRRRLGKALLWLRSASVQTLIADTIGWVPAHPGGKAYNTVSWEAQSAWRDSSFLWQPRREP